MQQQLEEILTQARRYKIGAFLIDPKVPNASELAEALKSHGIPVQVVNLKGDNS